MEPANRPNAGEPLARSSPLTLTLPSTVACGKRRASLPLFFNLPPNMETNNPQRSLPEQIEFAYLTLLIHLEGLLSDVTEMVGEEDVNEDIRHIHVSLSKMVSKNAKLKHKLYMIAKEKM